MKTVAIIQARMASTRLPRKVLADLGGEPLLRRVVDRARRAAAIDVVMVATSDAAADNELARFCEEASIPCVRGSERDVLDRYHTAAAHLEADAIVRITADCPLLDPEVVDNVVRAFQSGSCDYVSNTLKPTYPDGLDVEVFTRESLRRAWAEARLESEREHVTPYIWKSPDRFRLQNVECDRDLSHLRWTVDEPADLEFVRMILRHLGGDASFGMDDILRLLERFPELAALNAGLRRNEGYARSLEHDRMTTRP